MSRFLNYNEKCPLHLSYFCEPCHRPRKPKLSPDERRRTSTMRPMARPPQRKPAVSVVEDQYVERGFREVCNPQERRRRKFAHMLQQENICPLCSEKFTNVIDVELCHKESQGMGGAWRDDSMEMTFAGHRWCNREQGSMSLADYLAKKGRAA